MNFVGSLGKCLVLYSLTLASSLSKFPRPPDECKASAKGECDSYNGLISENVILVPWAVTVMVLVVLSAPTLLVEHGGRVRGVQEIFFTLVFVLIFVFLCCSIQSRSCAYALSVYSSVYLLTNVRVGPYFVGSSWWWDWRYAAVCYVVGAAVFSGPPVSVFAWDGSPPLFCALEAHVAGLLAPELVKMVLDAISDVAWEAAR